MLHRFHRCYIDFYNPALPLRWWATRCVSRPKFWAEELVKSHTSSWNPCALLKSLHHPWAHLWAVLRAQCWSFPKWERGSVWAVASPQWLIWQHTLPLGWFHSIQRWHNTHKPRALFSKCCCLLLSGWESSLVPLSGSSLLVASGWEVKGKSMGIHSVRLFLIWGFEEGYFCRKCGSLHGLWLVCLLWMLCPQWWSHTLEGCSNHCSPVWWVCHPGSCCSRGCVLVSWNLSAISLTGAVSDMHSLGSYFHVFIILQASVTFPEPSCWSLRSDHLLKVPAGIIWPFSSGCVGSCSSWYAQFGSGFLMSNLKPTVEISALGAQWYEVQHNFSLPWIPTMAWKWRLKRKLKLFLLSFQVEVCTGLKFLSFQWHMEVQIQFQECWPEGKAPLTVSFLVKSWHLTTPSSK